MSPEDKRAMDITLDGQDPVLLGAAKMTLIVPKGGVLKKHLFETQSLPGSPDYWNDAAVVLICPCERAGPSEPINSYNPLWYAHDPDDTGNRGYGYTFQDFPSSYSIV